MAIERTLRVLRLQAELELADAARALAQRSDQHAAAQQHARRVADALDAARDQMRRQIEASQLNPAGYDWVRRVWRAGRERLQVALAQERDAEYELQTQRSALAQARQHESDLQRALDAQAGLQRREDVARDHAEVDALWLQTHWRTR